MVNYSFSYFIYTLSLYLHSKLFIVFMRHSMLHLQRRIASKNALLVYIAF
jgi:hypothetical protein